MEGIITNLCKFCGEELKDNKCPKEHIFKKMCLNCQFAIKDEAGEVLFCTNKENLESIKNKMLKVANEVSESYGVANIDVKPLPLKKPTRKCGLWSLSEDVKKELINLFD